MSALFAAEHLDVVEDLGPSFCNRSVGLPSDAFLVEARIEPFHRSAKGWSQEKLAQTAGVTYSTLTKIEGGYNTNPKVEGLIRLAKALGVTVTDLLGA